MAKEYVPVFFDWLDVTQDLTAEEKGNLIDAVVSYASGLEYEHLLTGGCKIAFRFMKGQVDRNNAISDLRSKAGSSKKEQMETNDIKNDQNESNDIKDEETETNLPKEKENKKEKEKENKKESNRRFTPPSLEEVAEYCKSRNNTVDPEQFIAFYASKGWKVGKEPMKDWKMSVITWEKRNKQNKPPTKTVIAQQYQQRDYSGVQNEIQDELDREMEEYMRRNGA